MNTKIINLVLALSLVGLAVFAGDRGSQELGPSQEIMDRGAESVPEQDDAVKPEQAPKRQEALLGYLLGCFAMVKNNAHCTPTSACCCAGCAACTSAIPDLTPGNAALC